MIKAAIRGMAGIISLFVFVCMAYLVWVTADGWSHWIRACLVGWVVWRGISAVSDSRRRPEMVEQDEEEEYYCPGCGIKKW